MMAPTARDLFDGYLDAWNAHDPAAVARYMADDAIYEDVTLGRVLQAWLRGRFSCVLYRRPPESR